VQLTFEDLAALEPGLLELLREAESGAARKRWCAVAAWWGGPGYGEGLRERLKQLLGHRRALPRHPVLSTELAYNVAADHLVSLLPDCRGHASHLWLGERATPGWVER
jgi:hypothetical protein